MPVARTDTKDQGLDVPPALGPPRDERELIDAAAMEALRFTLHDPTTYVQRIVERLSFLPSGGQQWRRDVQIRLPHVETLEKGKEYDFIVSLGMFKRRRLPDFEAFDWAGRSLNLLTRFQHGHCLAESALIQYLLSYAGREELTQAATALAIGIADPHQERLAENYQAVYRALFDLFTSVDSEISSPVEGRLEALLGELGATPAQSKEAQELLKGDLALLANVTQYLCWVRGTPGGVVRLSATYTIPDAVRLSDRGSEEERSFAERVGSELSNFYTRIGIGPINYDMFTPANAHAGSYYFIVEPPVESRVSYLDWGLDNSASGIENEWVCAHRSAHVHNGARLVDFDEVEDPGEAVSQTGSETGHSSAGGESMPRRHSREEIENSKIYAYFRLDLSDHWQIAFSAALNLVFVWLAESGSLSSELGGSTKPWLLFTPAALIAYVAQQSRHYYSATTRWVRLIIWGYLAVSLGFLVSISFDLAKPGSFLDRNGVRDDLASVLMAAASILVLVLFVAMGRWHESFVRRWFRKAWKRESERRHWYQRLGRLISSQSSSHPRLASRARRLGAAYRSARKDHPRLGRFHHRVERHWRHYTRERKSVELYTRAARRWGNRVAFVAAAFLGALAFSILSGLAPDEGHLTTSPQPDTHRSILVGAHCSGPRLASPCRG